MNTRAARRTRLTKQSVEIEGLRRAAALVSKVHELVSAEIRPGVSTAELDAIAEEFILDNGATPLFKGYQMGPDVVPFPGTLCTSVNDVVVHGIPADTTLEEGDIVTIDVGARLEGFCGDCAATYAVGTISDEDLKLLDVTRTSVYRGAEQALSGNWVFDIARGVQECVEEAGFSVVRELVGHGIGRSLHEEPSVPNFVPNPFSRHRYRNQRLEEGMVLCIEPMVNAGAFKVFTEDDGWTVRTSDNLKSAHFEHMVLVLDGKSEILTTHFANPLESIR